MDKYYGKQIIGFNEENKRFIKLEADWILNIKDNEELGKQVRNKMLDKIKELDEHTEKIKKQIEIMKKAKWFIANNKLQKNKDIVNILPFIKVWYSQNYFFETGVFTPAFGIGVSFLKWNYYLTIQKGY